MPIQLARRLPVHKSADFDAELTRRGLPGLTRGEVTTLQVNLGKRCNQACLHCHVEAGPTRTEAMDLASVRRVLEIIAASPSITEVDITGGAPELHPHFRLLVEETRALGRSVIDRCNLTVLFEPGMEDLAPFLAAQGATVIASLPCYSAANVEAQRGKGVFDASIKGLLRLNELGYGSDERLLLHLVYNPVGPSLPPAQLGLEAAYKTELGIGFGIVFNRLFTITNMPIRRFLHALERDGKGEQYMDLLVASFNPATLPGVMCRSLVSVSWDGTLHDCDFHQMAAIALGAGRRTIWNIDNVAELHDADIATTTHCFGCTAGAGSSCGGSLES